MFLAAHCVPLTAALLGAPRLLARLEGRDSELCAMAAAYSLRLLPCLWLEVLNRCAPEGLPVRGPCNRAPGQKVPGYSGHYGSCNQRVSYILNAEACAPPSKNIDRVWRLLDTAFGQWGSTKLVVRFVAE